MIACDMDGVLTNWAKGFSELCHKLDSRAPVITDNMCPEWEWKKWYADGLIPPVQRDALIEQAWREVNRDPCFWGNLDPLFPVEPLVEATKKHPILFMTRRDGINPWMQTLQWLVYAGVEDPLVRCVRSGEEKGALCKRMGIRVIIDDSPKYAPEILANDVELVMIKWPYNDLFRRSCLDPMLYQVNDLNRALEVAVTLDTCPRVVV